MSTRQTKSLNTGSFLSISFFVLFNFIGCSTNDPVSPDNVNTVDNGNQSIKKVSASSVSIYNNVASFKQVSNLIQGPDAIVDLEIPEVENPESALQFAKSIQQKTFSKLSLDRKNLNKVQTLFEETVIWDVTIHDDSLGITIRSSLIYDTDTGVGRLFLVGYDYPEEHPLTYDSTEIVVDLNFSILDDSDDMLLSLENLKRYKPGRLIQQEIGRFEPDAYTPGTEPTGGVLSSDITYSSSSFISHTQACFEYHEGVGGSFSKESTFSDGKTSREEVTFNLDGTGTFFNTRRDGTQIDGLFDSADEDGEGSYSLTTTFPEGHDPVSISESGEFTLNSEDSTIDGSFEKEVNYLDGTVEKESVTVNQTIVNNIKTTTLTVVNADGSHGKITLVETPDVDQVSGNWTNVDDTYVVFSAEHYSDGSAHLIITVYESETAFQNGDDPIASGEFDFYPDGSGHGTVTESGKTYDVTIHPDGSVTVEVPA